MGFLTKQIVINTGIETVFGYVADPHNAPSYIGSINSITSGPQGAPSVGQTWQAQADFLGRRASLTLRLTELVASKSVTFALESEPQAILSIRLAPGDAASQTLASLTLDVPAVPTMLLTVLMDGLLTADALRLKQRLERNVKRET